MKKRGSGHFEMVVAFTFFVGFTVFLFTTLEMSSTDGLSNFVLSDMGNGFFELTKVDFGSFFVVVEHDEGGCFSFDLEEGFFSFDLDDKGVLVEDLGGAEVDSGFSSGVLSVDSEEIYFRVKVSEEFDLDGLGGCDPVHSYDLGSVLEREVVSYSKLLELEELYFSDYEVLREDLGVSAVYDFGIVIEDLDIEMLPLSGIPDAVEVLADSEVFEVLSGSGDISNVWVSFRVW